MHTALPLNVILPNCAMAAAYADPQLAAQYAHIEALVERQVEEQPLVHAHSQRVGKAAAALAIELQATREQAALIALAGAVHDIGKLLTPATILAKPGTLTSGEWAVMMAHTLHGARLLQQAPGTLADFLTDVALNHHERLDGTGYYHRSEESLSMAVRLVSVADAADALMEERAYRSSLPLAAVMRLMTRQWAMAEEPVGPRCFDDRVLKAWLRVMLNARAEELTEADRALFTTLADPDFIPPQANGWSSGPMSFAYS